ncbi:hypothetical protein Ait01nite_075300 [Actinoplanes italicus]|nr:hypothetical protein Ait01nite_075300 [Actinoplanes italicus]
MTSGWSATALRRELLLQLLSRDAGQAAADPADQVRPAGTVLGADHQRTDGVAQPAQVGNSPAHRHVSLMRNHEPPRPTAVAVGPRGRGEAAYYT